MAVEPRELSVCTDCYLYLGAGDLDNAPDGLPDRIAARWVGWYLSVECGEESDLGFRVTGCDGCGDHCAGDKHRVLAFPTSTAR